MAIFAKYSSNQPCGYEYVLIALSKLSHEDSLYAKEHLEFFQFVLGVSGKSLYNVFALIGESCRTNNAFARRVGTHFLSCYIHRHNFAM